MLTYIKIFLDDLEALEPLGDAERGRLFTSLLQYAATGEVPQLGGNERFLFPLLRARIDRDMAEYEATIENRRVAGRAGGLAKASKASKCQQVPGLLSKSSKDKDKDEDKDKDKDEDKDEDKSSAPVQWAENVTMTNAEHQKLLDAYGEADTARLIEILDNYKGSTGKRYKSDYRAILSWCIERLEEEKAKALKGRNTFLDLDLEGL